MQKEDRNKTDVYAHSTVVIFLDTASCRVVAIIIIIIIITAADRGQGPIVFIFLHTWDSGATEGEAEN